MHKLELTNGVRLLAHNLLHAQDIFTKPSEVLRAAKIVDLLACPVKATPKNEKEEAELAAWQEESVAAVELTEPQRDLLKATVEKLASKLPPTKYVVSLLSQLGFE